MILVDIQSVPRKPKKIWDLHVKFKNEQSPFIDIEAYVESWKFETFYNKIMMLIEAFSGVARFTQ